MEEINGLGEGLIPSPEELLQGFSSLERERRGKTGWVVFDYLAKYRMAPYTVQDEAVPRRLLSPLLQ